MQHLAFCVKALFSFQSCSEMLLSLKSCFYVHNNNKSLVFLLFSFVFFITTIFGQHQMTRHKTDTQPS